MNTKLSKALLKKYPKLFRQSSETPDKTSMCFGFQCGDGWYSLIDAVCSQLQWDTDRNGYPQLEFTTVKEKFGTLRLYYDLVSNIIDMKKTQLACRQWYNPLRLVLGDTYTRTLSHAEVIGKWNRMRGTQDGIIQLAECLSATICEACGSNDDVKVSTGGWVYTRCGKCRKSAKQLK